MDQYEWVNKTYGVNACDGRVVYVNGKTGIITGTKNAYILVRFAGDKTSSRCHPTWEVQYTDYVKNLPKVNRSAERYQRFLSSDIGISFGEWLKAGYYRTQDEQYENYL